MALSASQRANIVQVCSLLAQEENLKVTIQESGKGALIAGMGVFIGGILGGPPGMAVGGTLSSIYVACSARGKFKSVIEVIDEMNEDQKRRLCQAVKKALEEIRPEDVMGVLTLALTSTSVKEVILKEIGLFLLKEMNLHMIR